MIKQGIIHIIITDDNAIFTEGLKFQLSRMQDCDVIDVCKNGEELVNNGNLHKADLLFIDIEMPVMNGIESAKIVNNKYPDLPMIALTMHQEMVLLQNIIAAGFKGIIYKPEVPKKLSETIRKVLSNQYAFPDNLKICKNGGLL